MSPDRGKAERLNTSPPFLLYMAKSSRASVAPSALPDLDKYQAEDDHRTMTRSAEIQQDPKRMAGVKRHHRKQQRALGSVGRLIGGKR